MSAPSESSETPGTPGTRRAWGWVAHLRAGGSTPWADWSGEQPSSGSFLPGAQQLELLRRLNLAGRPAATLRERVLAASAPGRGRPDLELAGVVAPRRFGPPPVDPGALPDAELVRLASGLLAEDVVAAGQVAAGEVVGRLETRLGRAAALPRPWRRHYRLVGDPWLADPVRAHLVARGRPPGGAAPVALVWARDLPTMLSDAWMSRSFSVGGPSWRGWLRIWVERRQVPPRADVVAMARFWADRLGTDRVQVVLDPAALPRLVGVRRGLPAPRRVSAEGAELARHVASVLSLLVDPPRRAELLERTLLPRLDDIPGSRLVVPARHADWLERQSVRMRDELVGDGYLVHGDPDILLPGPTDAVTRSGPGSSAVLELAVRLLLDQRHVVGQSGPEEVES